MFQYKEEDEKVAARVAARNGLESYAYSLRNTINDEKVSGKLDASDKQKLTAAVDEVIRWLDKNQEGTVEEYEHKKSVLEAEASPIMSKMYQGTGAGPAGPTPPQSPQETAGTSGPTVEEVD